MRRAVPLLILALALPAAAQANDPQPGTPEYVQRDNENMQDAYGREFGANGQVQNPNYAPALIAEGNENGFDQLAAQLATPNRLALTPGQYFPGWNVGNPLRRGWAACAVD